MSARWVKKGFIYQPENENGWWISHAMAPAAIQLDKNTIRIFMGGLDKKGISRIGYIDVDAENPKKIKNISQKPVVDIGVEGAFDENGVFPAHVYKIKNKILLYYTGFQLGYKVRHYNFGGLAISKDNGKTFQRYSNAPILDRADEGLCVRAGQSVILEKGQYRTVYSAGTEWENVGGKMRPTYDVFYQDSKDGMTYAKSGKRIISCNRKVEHGLGRPQIVKLAKKYYIFYTRRMVDMKYHMGCAESKDGRKWKRIDEWVALPHGKKGEFDSEMVYFPCVITTEKGRTFLFYGGNEFGRAGFGYAELIK